MAHRKSRQKEVAQLMKGMGYGVKKRSRHSLLWEHDNGAICRTPITSDSNNAIRDIRQRAKKAIASRDDEIRRRAAEQRRKRQKARPSNVKRHHRKH